MAHDEAAPVVDFVVGEEPDRPLPPPRGPGARRRSRRRIGLVVGLVALAAGGLIGRALVTRDSPPRAASHVASTTTASAAPDPLAARPVQGGFVFCPQYTACSVTGRLPSAVLGAVRAQFPGAVLGSATTVLVRRDNAPSNLAEREVVLRAGTTTVTVLVRARDVPGGSARQGARQVTRVTDDDHYVTVTVDVVGSAALPAYDRLDRLVADARLLAQ